MNAMEYRAWITVPDLPVEPDDAWLPLARHLDREHGEYGPILGGTAHGPCVVLATDAASERAAREILTASVADSLEAVGLGALQVSRVELEPVRGDGASAAA